jgi:hypothetical protein
MSISPDAPAGQRDEGSPRLALLLAMAMFVLVIDMSLMNVSISAVIRDLHTTASGVQSAIALEALVSAAFILTNSKMGDLTGRRLAYVVGLLAYAVGAVAMTLAHNLNTIIIFWAIIGGLGASLLLPAMQSLILASPAGGRRIRRGPRGARRSGCPPRIKLTRRRMATAAWHIGIKAPSLISHRALSRRGEAHSRSPTVVHRS